jgi:hypothetical protein
MRYLLHPTLLLIAAFALGLVLAQPTMAAAQSENAASPQIGMAGMPLMQIPFSITYEDTPDGVRLTLTPKDPGKLEEFRRAVRTHVEQMNKHECPMMREMMRGMLGGMMNGMMGNNSEPPANSEPKPKTDETDHSAHHSGEKK